MILRHLSLYLRQQENQKAKERALGLPHEGLRRSPAASPSLPVWRRRIRPSPKQGAEGCCGAAGTARAAAGPRRTAPALAQRARASSAQRLHLRNSKRHPHMRSSSIHPPLHRARRLPRRHGQGPFRHSLPSSPPPRSPEERWKPAGKLLIAPRVLRCRHDGVGFDEELSVSCECTALRRAA